MSRIYETTPWQSSLYSYVIIEIPHIAPYVILTNYPLLGSGLTKQPDPNVDVAFYKTLSKLQIKYKGTHFHELIVPLPCTTSTFAVAVMGHYHLHRMHQLWFYGNTEKDHKQYKLISPLVSAHRNIITPINISLADIKISIRAPSTNIGGAQHNKEDENTYNPFDFDSCDEDSDNETQNMIAPFYGGNPNNDDITINDTIDTSDIPDADLSELRAIFSEEPVLTRDANVSASSVKLQSQKNKHMSEQLMICLGNNSREYDKVRLKADFFACQIKNGAHLLCLPMRYDIIKTILHTCNNCPHRQLHFDQFVRMCGLIAPNEISSELESKQLITATNYVKYAKTYLPRGFMLPEDFKGQVITHHCRELVMQYNVLATSSESNVADFNLLYDIVSSSDNKNEGELTETGWTIAGCFMYSHTNMNDPNRIYVGHLITADELSNIIHKLGISSKIVAQLLAFLCFGTIKVGTYFHTVPFLILMISNIPPTIAVYHWSEMVSQLDDVLISDPLNLPNIVYDQIRFLFRYLYQSPKITEHQQKFLNNALESFNIADFKYTYSFIRTSLIDFERTDLITKHILEPLFKIGVVKDFVLKKGRYKRLDMNLSLAVSRAHPHTINYLAQLAEPQRTNFMHKPKRARRQKIFDNLNINLYAAHELFLPGKQLQITANFGHLSITVTNYNSIENLIMIMRIHCAIVGLLFDAYKNNIPIFNLKELSSTIDQLTKLDPKRFVTSFDSPFSSHCQDKRQPRLISEAELSIIHAEKTALPINIRAYWNATTHQKLYIVCNEPYSSPSIIPVSSTLERGAPCCNSQPAAKSSIQAKLLELYFNNDQVPLSLIMSIQNPKSIQNAHLISPLKKIEANKYYQFGSPALQTYMRDPQHRIAMVSLGAAIYNIEMWPIHMLSMVYNQNPLNIIVDFKNKIKLLETNEIYHELCNIGLMLDAHKNPHDEINKLLQLYNDLLNLGHPTFETKYLVPYILEMTKWLIYMIYNIIILEMHEQEIKVIRLREISGLRAIAARQKTAPGLLITVKMKNSPLVSVACTWKQPNHPLTYFFQDHLYIDDLLITILSHESLSAHHRLINILHNSNLTVECFYVSYGEVVYGIKCSYKNTTGFIPCAPFLFIDDRPALYKAPSIPGDLFSLDILAELWPAITGDKHLPKWIMYSELTQKAHLVASSLLLVPCKPTKQIPAAWVSVKGVYWPHDSLPTVLRHEPIVPNKQIVKMLQASPVAIRIALYESVLINLNTWLISQRDFGIRGSILKDYHDNRIHSTWVRYCKFPQDHNILLDLLSKPNFELELNHYVCYFDMYAGFIHARKMDKKDRIEWLITIIEQTLDQLTNTWNLSHKVQLSNKEILQTAQNLSLIFNYDFMFARLVDPRVCEHRAHILSKFILLLNTAQSIH